MFWWWKLSTSFHMTHEFILAVQRNTSRYTFSPIRYFMRAQKWTAWAHPWTTHIRRLPVMARHNMNMGLSKTMLLFSSSKFLLSILWSNQSGSWWWNWISNLHKQLLLTIIVSSMFRWLTYTPKPLFCSLYNNTYGTKVTCIASVLEITSQMVSLHSQTLLQTKTSHIVWCLLHPTCR